MKSAKMQNVAVALVLAAQLFVAVAFAQTRPAVELEGAIAKEQVDGDLKTAIAIYQKIAADTSVPRDVSAKALLHLARCYEKLGDQSQTVYRQIVRDFGDQPEAVQAKARLAALEQADRPTAPTGMTQHTIELPSPYMDPEDTDGGRAVYGILSGKEVELIYGDLVGKSIRMIFKAKSDDLPDWAPSRDFSKVLIVLHKWRRDEQQTVAVVKTDGTDYREIAHLDARRNADGEICHNWSWNNRYILLCGQSPEGANRLLRISVADGETHELLGLKAGEVRTASFYPDSRSVAYQVPASQADDPVSRIFIIPAEGGEPKLVYEERQAPRVSRDSQALTLLDWTADGRYLAIASEETGKGALRLLPIREGRAAGAPVFVQYGNFEDGTTTAAGKLIYQTVKPGGPSALYLAMLDPTGRPVDWKRLDLHLGKTLSPLPKWCADSNQIAYVVRGQDTGQAEAGVVHLYNLTTGEDHEIHHAPGDISCSWAVQQPKLFCADYVPEQTDIFSIAIDSLESRAAPHLSGVAEAFDCVR